MSVFNARCRVVTSHFFIAFDAPPIGHQTTIRYLTSLPPILSPTSCTLPRNLHLIGIFWEVRVKKKAGMLVHLKNAKCGH